MYIGLFISFDKAGRLIILIHSKCRTLEEDCQAQGLSAQVLGCIAHQYFIRIAAEPIRSLPFARRPSSSYQFSHPSSSIYGVLERSWICLARG